MNKKRRISALNINENRIKNKVRKMSLRKVLRSGIVFSIFVSLNSCVLLESVFSGGLSGVDKVSEKEVVEGLKAALHKGVKEQVVKLTLEDGFYKNEKVKIYLPEDLQKVHEKFTSVGLGYMSEEGIKLLNRAAEEAAKEAIPIFTDAILNIKVTDAFNILKGHDSSATQYLTTATHADLYQKFLPIVKANLEKVNAPKTWNTIAIKYNVIPFVKKINPDLTNFVTQKALEGIFRMIATEEALIRKDFSHRTSSLLKKVFALQDTPN